MRYICIVCGAGGGSGNTPNPPESYHCHICECKSSMLPVTHPWIKKRDDIVKGEWLSIHSVLGEEMNYKELVKLSFPNAWVNYLGNYTYIVWSKLSHAKVLGKGFTADQAWLDAYERVCKDAVAIPADVARTATILYRPLVE